MSEVAMFPAPDGIRARIDHVGVLVRSIDQSIGWFEERLGMTRVTESVSPDGAVRYAYLQAGDTTLQLVEPLGPGPLAEALAAEGEGLHHVCFAVPGFPEALRMFPGEEDARVNQGGQGRPVCFLKARPGGVRIEFTAPPEG